MYDARLGCARERCVAPAIPFKLSLGTEMCALPGQGRYGYGAAVEYRRCEALHRRWVSATDWCASNPDRGRKLITDAPQCVAPATTYVTHDETEGWYDECLRPHRVAQLQRLADRHGTSLAREAAARSRTLCAYRPGHTFKRGRCRPGAVPDATASGTLLVGDSLTWRGTDELGELAAGPDDRRAAGTTAAGSSPVGSTCSSWPTATRPDSSWSSALTGTAGTATPPSPRTSPACRPRPWSCSSCPTGPTARIPRRSQHSTTVYSGWMRSLAASRPRSCVADWRAVVEEHPGLLGDGVHLAPSLELFWAKWLKRSWDACLAQAQRADS